jgi:lipopolysaccharide heptosyltransferase II
MDALGDVLMTGPAIRALKTRSRVTLLTSPAGGAVAELMPEVDETLVYEAPWMKASRPGSDSGPAFELVNRLRGRRFDAAVIFTVYSQSALPAALLCTMAEIPLRLAHCRENPYGLLSDWVPEPEPEEQVRHEVRRQLDLVETIGRHCADQHLRLAVAPAARRRVSTLLSDAGIEAQGRWIVAHPGASAPSRRYPPELFAAACASLADEHGVALVFTGDEHERSLVDDVRERIAAPSISLAGRLALGELAALLEAAPVLVAGNTGPVHLAAAVGTPVVDIYALTNPQHTPWGVPSAVLSHDVSCRWCYKSVCPTGHHLCVRGVKPEAVVEATLRLLESARRGRAPALTFRAGRLG